MEPFNVFDYESLAKERMNFGQRYARRWRSTLRFSPPERPWCGKV